MSKRSKRKKDRNFSSFTTLVFSWFLSSSLHSSSPLSFLSTNLFVRMSGALARAAAVAARRLTGQGASCSSSSSLSSSSIAHRHHQQQLRFAGDLPVKSNPFVERWGTSRAHIEDTFFFDRKNFARAAAWVVGFPLAVYFGIVRDFENADERAKGGGAQRPPMLGRDDRPDAEPAAGH